MAAHAKSSGDPSSDEHSEMVEINLEESCESVEKLEIYSQEA